MGRPMKLKSETCKMKIACGHLYITVSFHEKSGLPYETFIKGGKLSGCHALQDGLGRATSILLKNNLLKETVDAYENIICHACAKLKVNMSVEEKKAMANSCPDALARVLKEYIKEDNIDKEKQ